MTFYATCVCEVSGCALFSKAFLRIWKRPLLVDHLISIWEQRKENQDRRDLMQAQMLHIIDIFAVDQRNINRGKDDKPFESILAGFQKKPEADDNIDIDELYFAAERRRREELGI